jgi:hypothetical protein
MSPSNATQSSQSSNSESTHEATPAVIPLRPTGRREFILLLYLVSGFCFFLVLTSFGHSLLHDYFQSRTDPADIQGGGFTGWTWLNLLFLCNSSRAGVVEPAIREHLGPDTDEVLVLAATSAAEANQVLRLVQEITIRK